MLNVVEVRRDLGEQRVEAPVVAKVDGDQGEEGWRRHDLEDGRKWQTLAAIGGREV